MVPKNNDHSNGKMSERSCGEGKANCVTAAAVNASAAIAVHIALLR
jgi:hypothetical protein